MKEHWPYIKKHFAWLTIVMLVGFGLGKIYTWDAVITDCKVLGMTRFGMTPMGCQVGEKYK